MTNKATTRRTRRMAREPQAAAQPAASKAPSRLAQLEQLLTRENGTSIAEMVEATGWQQHSVRGAMAGALKKRGLTIASEKVEGVRRYRAERPA
jgi:hypothetical protein